MRHKVVILAFDFTVLGVFSALVASFIFSCLVELCTKQSYSVDLYPIYLCICGATLRVLLLIVSFKQIGVTIIFRNRIPSGAAAFSDTPITHVRSLMVALRGIRPFAVWRHPKRLW